MKLDYIVKEETNTRLILIAAGWSTGPLIARDVAMEGWDVAVMHDFTELSLDTSFLDEYYTVYLFAWSLGVYAASRVLPAERITEAIALNGTLWPVDDARGIPRAIFKGTADSLDARNLLKFRIRMAGSREGASSFGDGNDDIESLRRQLLTILETGENDPDAQTHEFPWTRAFISENDRIFPPENMRRAWMELTDVAIVSLPEHHYVNPDRIIRMVIADTRKVSDRFGAAVRSYDTHAIAQYSAAIKLASLLADKIERPVEESVEIGCGTGLFTREYSRVISPFHALFVDITPTGPFGIAPWEEYKVEDAERWIERDTRTWDAILSASAIQWFADIPRFLHLCSERLNPGGVLAVSTFLPGNMGELDEYRPSPLRYPSATRLREWMVRDFVDVEVVEDEIAVEFQSVREMLMHLKHTGVAGSAPGGGLPLREMSHLRRLTYRPVYVFGRRRQ